MKKKQRLQTMIRTLLLGSIFGAIFCRAAELSPVPQAPVTVAESSLLPPPEEAIIVARAQEARRQRQAKAAIPEVPGTTAPVPAKSAAGSIAANTSGKTLYSFQATDLELKVALASFARA